MVKRRKTRLKHLAEKVAKGERIVGMECHDTPSAIIAEELGMDLLCCGSPGPMGLMGHKSMATVDFEEQLYHAGRSPARSVFAVHNLQYAQHNSVHLNRRIRAQRRAGCKARC